MNVQQMQEDAYDVGILTEQIPEQQDVYTWHAIYDDDVVVSEFDRPEGRGFAEVELFRVKTLLLTPLQGVGSLHRVDIPKGAQPVFFRRRSIVVGLLPENEQGRTTTHCIGWKKAGLLSDVQETYLFVFDDGSSFLTNDLQAV